MTWFTRLEALGVQDAHETGIRKRPFTGVERGHFTEGPDTAVVAIGAGSLEPARLR